MNKGADSTSPTSLANASAAWLPSSSSILHSSSHLLAHSLMIWKNFPSVRKRIRHLLEPPSNFFFHPTAPITSLVPVQ
uniref:Uncharacterized protein n=1 Tax=Salix viminalis TaxID=40686 RepID=A0A6N2KYV7_SALVM